MADLFLQEFLISTDFTTKKTEFACITFAKISNRYNLNSWKALFNRVPIVTETTRHKKTRKNNFITEAAICR